MKGSLALAALAGVVLASPVPQGQAATPVAGCQSSVPGTFQISVVNVTRSAKRELESRQEPDGTLRMTLQNGVLKDSQGRTGNIVANHQFQFDNPIQDNAIYTSGWSVCSNGSLALTSAVFYQCLSGTFYNLYDQSQGGQCNAVYIVTSGAGASSGGSSAPAAPPAPTPSQVSDGQPQAPTAPASQISDGQVQATTKPAAPVTQITDGQIQASTKPVAPVTQISDGQIQATTMPMPVAPVTQISDGQIQATTMPMAPPVTQISDGQIQATTGAPVSQITDGQIQAPTSGAPVTQITDGQIQAPTSPAVATFTGAANRELAGSFAFVAGIVGAVALL